MANQLKPMERIREFLDKITYRQWVVAAGVVSILLGLMVYLAMSGDDEKVAEKPQTNLVQVVAAKQDIPERTVVKEDMLKVVEVPSELVPEVLSTTSPTLSIIRRAPRYSRETS